MGWTIPYDTTTRKDLIHSLTEPYEWDTPLGAHVKRTCLAHTYKGSAWAGVLYSVFERQHAGDSPIRYITVHLLRYYRDVAGGNWGYKDMDESVHPYYYGCPLKYLDMVPEVANAEWREGVRKYWAHKNRMVRGEWKMPRGFLGDLSTASSEFVWGLATLKGMGPYRADGLTNVLEAEGTIRALREVHKRASRLGGQQIGRLSEIEALTV